jgi:hypothetical protein
MLRAGKTGQDRSWAPLSLAIENGMVLKWLAASALTSENTTGRGYIAISGSLIQSKDNCRSALPYAEIVRGLCRAVMRLGETFC